MRFDVGEDVVAEERKRRNAVQLVVGCGDAASVKDTDVVEESWKKAALVVVVVVVEVPSQKNDAAAAAADDDEGQPEKMSCLVVE